jgi:hypothetical protein
MKCRFKCGDIVHNHGATYPNPTRYFIFIENCGKYSKVIDYDGKQIETGRYYTSDLANEEAFSIVGHIDLIHFLKAPLLRFLSEDCLNCDYWKHNDDWGAFMCMNKESENYDAETARNDFCDKWKEITSETALFEIKQNWSRYF